MRLRLIPAVLFAAIVSCDQERQPTAGVSDIEHAVDPEAAYVRAIELQRTGHHLESVPFFRRAIQGHPDISRLHLEYGEALYNGATETDLSLGFVRFVVPSSQERTALVNEAMLELRRSEELARTPDERAYALFIIARTQSLLGLPADALESAAMARVLAPNVDVLRHLEHSLEATLSDDNGLGATSELARRPPGRGL